MSTSVSGLTSNFFPSAQNGFTTTTSGSVASGATTVGLNSVSGYSNGQVAVFVIDPTDATKKQTFTGVIDTSGVQVTSVVWTAGTNQSHALGATVVDYETATHWSMVAKGITQEHNQNGTHAAVTATSVSTDTISEKTAAAGVTIDTMTIKDGLVVGGSSKGVNNSSLDTSAGALGAAWQSWTPSWTNVTVNNGTVTAKYIQIGKIVHASLTFVLGTTSSVSGDAIFSLPVTAASYAGLNNLTVAGTAVAYDTSATVVAQCTSVLATTTTCSIRANRVSGSQVVEAVFSGTVPFGAAFATGDEIHTTIVYEAA